MFKYSSQILQKNDELTKFIALKFGDSEVGTELRL